MPVTRLYLVRHGQSDGNAEGRFGGHSPTPLSALGKQQAELTAQTLAKEKINHIYSSDLLRAVQTAQPLAKMLDLPTIATAAFRERKVGVLEGKTFDESKAEHPKDYYAPVNRNIHHIITGGESYRRLLKRATGELHEVLRAHQGENVVIFSHTGAICYLTLYLIGAINRYTKTTPWWLLQTAESIGLKFADEIISASTPLTIRAIYSKLRETIRSAHGEINERISNYELRMPEISFLIRNS